MRKYTNILEGSEFGAYYYEKLEQKVFEFNPEFSTSGSANYLCSAGYAIASSDLGGKRAQGVFRGEDFVSDFVSAYSSLQKQSMQ